MNMPKLICICESTVELTYNMGSNSNDDYEGGCITCGKQWAITDYTEVIGELEPSNES